MEELFMGCFVKVFGFLAYTLIPIMTIVTFILGICTVNAGCIIMSFILFIFSIAIYYPIIDEKWGSKNNNNKKEFGLPVRTEGQQIQRQDAIAKGNPTYSYDHRMYHTKTNYPCEYVLDSYKMKEVHADPRMRWEKVNTPYYLRADSDDPRYRYYLQTTSLAEIRGVENRANAIEHKFPFYRRAINYKSTNVRDYSFELTYETATDKPYTVEQVGIASLWEFDQDTNGRTNTNNYYKCFKYDIAYDPEKDKEPRRINRREINLSTCKNLYDRFSMNVKNAYNEHQQPVHYYRNDADPNDAFNIYRDYLPYADFLKDIKKLKEQEEFIFLFDSDTLNGSPIVKVTYMPVDFIDGIEVSDQALGKFLGTGTFLRNGDDEFYRLSKRVNRKLYNEIVEKYTDVSELYSTGNSCLIVNINSPEALKAEVSTSRKKLQEITG